MENLLIGNHDDINLEILNISIQEKIREFENLKIYIAPLLKWICPIDEVEHIVIDYEKIPGSKVKNL